MSRWRLVIVVIILGMIGYFRVGSSAIDYIVACITYPAVRMVTWVTDGTTRWYRHYRSVRELAASLEQSQETIAHLTAEVVALRGIRIHLDEVRELRRFRHRYETDWLLSAQVVARTISPEAHVIILDKGERHGVVRDMVAVYQNCLVGRVSDVYPWWCKVVLITDRLSKIPVTCSETHTEAIFEGINESNRGLLTYVSHLAPLQLHEMVLTSGQGFIYPQGFAVGRIKEIRCETDKLQYYVTVQPMFTIQNIKVCYLLTKGSEYHESAPLDNDEVTYFLQDAFRSNKDLSMTEPA